MKNENTVAKTKKTSMKKTDSPKQKRMGPIAWLKSLTTGVVWISKKKAMTMFAAVLSISALVIAYMIVIDSVTLSFVSLFY